MIEKIKLLKSDRLVLNVGIRDTLSTIANLKKIRPNVNGNTIYIWYGLDKIKNELFLMNQSDEETEEPVEEPDLSREEMLDDVFNFLEEINANAGSKTYSSNSEEKDLSYEDCKSILRQAFEMGPENNHYHVVIFNNYKSLKKSGMIELDNFENRVGSRMSTDDSYELFGSSLAINKTDDNTVIYYAGSGQAIPLRPYLLSDEDWFNTFNSKI